MKTVASGKLKQIQTLAGHTALITRLDWSPAGTRIVSGSNDRTIKVWDTKTGKAKDTFESPYSRITNLSWSPNGKLIAAASIYEDVKLMDSRTGKIAGILSGHSGWVSSIAWSPDGESIATTCSDEEIRIWIAERCYLSKSLKGHTNPIKCVTWSPDGNTIASSSSCGSIRLWNTSTMEEECILKEHTDSVDCLAWSPDSAILASSSIDNTVRFWAPKEKKYIKVFKQQENKISCLAFSFDGKLFATMTEKGAIVLYNCGTWQEVESFDEPYTRRSRSGLAFHPAKPHLATISGESDSIHIWDLTDYIDSTVTQTTVKSPVDEPVVIKTSNKETLVAETPVDVDEPVTETDAGENTIIKDIMVENVVKQPALPEKEDVKPQSDSQSLFKTFPTESSGSLDLVKPDLKLWAGAARCTLAVAFTDVVGSTLLGNKLGNIEYSKLNQSHLEQGRKLLKRYSGYEIKTIGDSLMVAFHTATEILDFALAFYKRTGDSRIRIRVGIHVGPVSIEQNDVSGVSINYTARVESMAKGAEIWLSNEAKAHIDQEGFARHKDIEWSEHPDCEMKGFNGKFTLWSISNLKTM
ncbi:MAG: WD40 domain-containing protein [Candidatus Anammoxibacter sp.]